MSLDILASAASVVELETEMIARNIALSKVATSNEFRAMVADTGYQTMRGSSQNEAQTTLPIQKGQGVSVMGTAIVFKQGILKTTGHEYDLATNGKGFVELSGNNGTLYYARLRTVYKDKDGFLSMNGKRLNPPIQIPADASEFEVNKEGEVHIHVPGQTTKTLLGQIELVDFVNYNGLKITTWGDFEYTEDAGTITRGIAGINGFGEINQFKEEQSSINLTDQILNLIALGQKHGIIMKTIHKKDQMDAAVVSAPAN
jgi:flagellar basal-body rod protein FlgG